MYTFKKFNKMAHGIYLVRLFGEVSHIVYYIHIYLLGLNLSALCGYSKAIAAYWVLKKLKIYV